VLKSKRTEPRPRPRTSTGEHNSPSAFRLEEVLPTSRLLEERIARTFLRLLLVALALLTLPFGIRLAHYDARYAVFGPAVEPKSVGQGTSAHTSPFVFAEACCSGIFGSAFRAALLTVVEVAWVRHGWWGAGVVLGVVYDLV
jgi:hypothetical protein